MKEKKPESNRKEREVSPLEGKYVIARWQEVDTDDEIEATFLYKVVDGKVESIFGQSNLNSNPRDGKKVFSKEKGEHLYYNEAVVEIIKKMKIKEVYIVTQYGISEPIKNMDPKINEEFGLGYGFFDYDQPGVDYGSKDTTHNWGELDSMISDQVLQDLQNNKIKVKSYNIETKEISDY